MRLWLVIFGDAQQGSHGQGKPVTESFDGRDHFEGQQDLIDDFVEDIVPRDPEQKECEAPRPIKPVTFKGEGLSLGFAKASRPAIRDAIYEDHGA